MSDVDQEQKRPLTLTRTGTLGLARPAESGQVKQSFSHGRSKTVAVEVRKKRVIVPGAAPEPVKADAAPAAVARSPLSVASPTPETAEPAARRVVSIPRSLTADERAGRLRAVQDAQKADVEARQRALLAEEDRRREEESRAAEEARRQAEEEVSRRAEEEEAKKRSAEESKQRSADE